MSDEFNRAVVEASEAIATAQAMLVRVATQTDPSERRKGTWQARVSLQWACRILDGAELSAAKEALKP